MKNETVRKVTEPQFKDLHATLLQCIPADLSFDDAQEWRQFYRDEFGMDCDFSQIRFPEHRDGFDRLLIIPEGLTAECVFQQCKQRFNCWKFTDSSLEHAVPTNDRNPANGSYAIWLRDRVEADEELADKSANDLKAAGIQGVTLIERLLLELKYFKETGKHLDINNWTLCSGSRYSGGNVPFVYWGGDELSVYWYHPDYSSDDLRSREVCS